VSHILGSLQSSAKRSLQGPAKHCQSMVAAWVWVVLSCRATDAHTLGGWRAGSM
jgi:hypothetical protein